MKHRHCAALIALLMTLSACMTGRIQADDLPPQTMMAQREHAAADLAVFEEVWRTVREHFYDPTFRGLDWAAVGEKYRPLAAAAGSDAERSEVINRMLSGLSASHTGHYTTSEPAYYQLLDIFSRALRQPLKRLFPDGQVTYPGIGIFTKSLDGKTFISGVLDGLPASTAGLVVGDELLAADAAPFHPIKSFASKAGQEVTLTIRRRADGSPQNVVVVPEQIKPNEAFLKAMEESSRIIDADGMKIGYIHVWSYAGAQYQQLLERELSAGKLKDADALVWDLRDGWGGAEAEYLHLFTGRAPITTLINRDGRKSVANVTWRKPVTMLVNGGTRSGKEILAYGFKEYGVGEVIGSRTAGSVLAGRAYLLSDGSLLLLAVADVLVDDRRLEGVGVMPTIPVPFPLAYAQGQDPQLDRAVEVLSRTVGGRIEMTGKLGMMIFAAVLGFMMLVAVLWDAFETIILPRSVTHRFRLTQFFYRSIWRLWSAAAQWIHPDKRRETYLSIFGPLSLLMLLSAWAVGLVAAFAMIHWGLGTQLNAPDGIMTFSTYLYMSGTTFFTLGLWDVTPLAPLGRGLVVVEAGVGFGFLAVVISYLPILYQAFSRREVSISLLDARAGSPPSAGELLRRHGQDMNALSQVLYDWERWSAELLESHLSYPVLGFFRSQHTNQSWLAALTAILDTCAVTIAGISGGPTRQAQLTFAMARHAIVDLAQVFITSPRLVAPDRLPPPSLTGMREVLAEAGVTLQDGIVTDQKLVELRQIYEPYVHALSEYLCMPLPPWFRVTVALDSWQTSAWERITRGVTTSSAMGAHDDGHF